MRNLLQVNRVNYGKDYYIATQLIYFYQISTGGGKKAPQITPWGWIFWTMIFLDLEKITSRSIY